MEKVKKSYDIFALYDNKIGAINNDLTSDENLIRKIKNFLNLEFRFKTYCPFCNGLLVIKSIRKDQQSLDLLCNYGEYQENGKLWYCSHCGYWQFSYGLIYDDTEPHQDLYYAISKLKEFDEYIDFECRTKLAQYIRRNQSFWNTIGPKKLEIFVADIFSSYYTDCEVCHIGKPYDEGVDVLLINSDKKEWLIQVKRRSVESASEGVSTIRNLLGTLVLKDNKHGIVVSTADHFTYRAHKAAEDAKKYGYIIELIDKKTLNTMLDPLIPKDPWLDCINSIDHHILERLTDVNGESQQLTLKYFNTNM